MIRRFNYTKRVKIKREHIRLSVRELEGHPPVAAVSLELSEYRLPPEASLIVEAYRKATYMRVPLGPVSATLTHFEFPLTEFASVEGVLFRVKAIGRSTEMVRNGPVLLAVADHLSPDDNPGDAGGTQSLIRLEPHDLGGEIWRLDLTNQPVILFEKTLWKERERIVRSGWFFALVLPTVLRQSITVALTDDYRELDDDGDWRSAWLRFAIALPGDSSLPEGDAVEEWVDAKVEAFCRWTKTQERLRAAREGGDD